MRGFLNDIAAGWRAFRRARTLREHPGADAARPAADAALARLLSGQGER